MSLRRKAIGAVAWSVTQKSGSAFISFLAFVVLVRVLEVRYFGIIAMAAAFTSLLDRFIDQGFASAVIQRKELEPKHLDSVFWVAIGTGCLLMIVGLAGAGVVARLYSEPELESVIRVLSLNFVLVALSSTQQAILTRHLRFRSLALRSLSASSIGGIVGVSMALTGFGVWSLVFQSLASNGVAVAVLWGASDWRPGFRFSVPHFRDMFGFSSRVFGINIFAYINRHADDLLIGYFLGATALGYYTVAYKLIRILVGQMTKVTNAVLFPAFSRVQEDVERVRRGFYEVTQYSGLIAFPVFIGMAVVAPQLVPLLYGEQWLPSVPVMQVLAFVGMVQALSFYAGTTVLAMGRPSWLLKVSALSAAVTVLAFLFAVRWGIVAMAAAYTISSYLMLPILLLLVRKLILIRASAYLMNVSGPLLGAAVMGAVLLLLRVLLEGHVTSRDLLVIQVVVGIVTYGVILLLTARPLLNRVLHMLRLFGPTGRVAPVGRGTP